MEPTKLINFIAGGKMGDFIHSLFVVKAICDSQNAKANVYMIDGHGGDIWTNGLQKSFGDIGVLIFSQPYVHKLFDKIEEGDFSGLACPINLNNWRTVVAETHANSGKYNRCWTELLSEVYKFPQPKNYAWLEVCLPRLLHHNMSNKIVVHRSKHHHNPSFPWQKILEYTKEEVVFLTCDMQEWELFPFKKENVIPYYVPTMTEMAGIIKTCKLFIGNLSAPFALASALDVPRLCELDADPAPFEMDEIKYSQNLSWILNDDTKYFSQNSIINL